MTPCHKSSSVSVWFRSPRKCRRQRRDAHSRRFYGLRVKKNSDVRRLQRLSVTGRKRVHDVFLGNAAGGAEILLQRRRLAQISQDNGTEHLVAVATSADV